MTKTLTTEAMQEIYEAAVHSEASGSQEAEFELLCKLEDVGGISATIRKLIDMVRAANREAVPVAATPIYQIWDDGRWYDAEERIWRETYNEACKSQFRIVYTAPPAPAVPDICSTAVNDAAWKMHDTLTEHGPLNGHQFNNLKGCFYEALKIAMSAPPAPAVPDAYCIMPLTLTAANGAKGALSGEFKVSRTVRCHECGGEGCDDCADAGEFEEEITVPWDTIKDIYRAAVDTCRAAMLSHVGDATDKVEPVMICYTCGQDADHQGNRTYKCDNGHVFQMRSEPVSQGYKLGPIEPDAIDKFVAQVCGDLPTSNKQEF